MKKNNILLDMDGILTDFIGAAIELLNVRYNKMYTIKDYQSFGKYHIEQFYDISLANFWETLDSSYDFWYKMKPLPWYRRLYERLKDLGEVTIITAPSWDPKCVSQKVAWLRDNLGITADEVMITKRKYLCAGNGILIDDCVDNVVKFQQAGGQAILVPSNWNTPGLSFDTLWKGLEYELSPIIR